ncbi:cullin binding-domain containing protein [Nitzschia inconspicua]|uniref:Defective in cullin neddylation protein n=1 Tax=Nitzschia inconspicua TaxID=303405 RepID=A0A9K3Q3K9_9STRA|nr:cullin binding-domain containing protein [Nitzschia inconspicua]
MWTSSGSSSASSKTAKRKSSSTAGSAFNEKAAEKMFEEFAEEDDPTVMGMDGIIKLCDHMDLDPFEDKRVLVLLWKLGSKEKPSQITKEEFLTGCYKLHVDTIEKFQSLIPSLDTGFLDEMEFKDFYKFCFQFNRQGTHRTLDKELVVALMKMVLTGRIPDDRLETFCTFVETQEAYTRITLDQWTSFLDFCFAVPDLSQYDESSSAWPVLIDEYVEFMEELQKKK